MKDYVEQQLKEKERLQNLEKLAQREYEAQDKRCNELLTQAQEEHEAK